MARVSLDPEELAVASRVLARSASVLAQESALLDLGETAWVVAKAALPRAEVQVSAALGGLDLAVNTDHTFAERARACALLHDDLVALTVLVTVEERRLEGLAATLLAVSRVWAGVERAVSLALRAVDAAAYDHPGLVERQAAAAQNLLPVILEGAERGGWLTEANGSVVSVVPEPPRSGPVPRTLGDVIAGDAEVEQETGRVRVIEVHRGDGTSAWVVQISGTQAWSPTAGEEAFDLTTDVRDMAGEVTQAAIGVHLALMQAQRSTGRDTSGEPVLITGHSLGGMMAATLAADPVFREGRTVAGVVTAGSPIDRFKVPTSIPVVSLEHGHDAVPRLDGISDPQRPGRVTVTVNPSEEATGGLASRSHSGALYAESARQLSAPASGCAPARPWDQVIDPILSGGETATVHDFTVSRQWQNPRP